MKKILTFIPLAVGISSAIIYIINIVNFRIINNSVSMMQILSNLKIYLYISIAGFISYFFIRVLTFLPKGKIYNERLVKEDYEPLEVKEVSSSNENIVSNQISNVNFENKNETINEKVKEKTVIKEIILTGNKYCSRCGEKIFDTDTYCKNCGSYQKDKKSGVNPVLKNIISVLQIVILILILYFLVNMLFEYKQKTDSNFKSPFKISMMK